MPYISFTPKDIFTKAMFDFGVSNFIFTGPIKVSVSDGFSNLDYALKLVNSTNFTMNPYSNEIAWSSTVKNNIQNTLSVLSSFANLKFSALTDYDTSGWGLLSIASPADVGLVSDINISLMNANSSSFLGISSGSTDLLGYTGSRGDVFINATGSAFTYEGVTFADSTKSRQVLMHELLHSLGLSHPFNTNAIVKPNYAELLSAGFNKLGFVINDKNSINKEYFSIMSYDDESSISYINAYTPMIFDVIALQNAYGEGNGTTSNSNDNIIAGNVGYRTYFDTGGIDTIDLNYYEDGAYINLGVTIKNANHLVGVIMTRTDGIATFSGESPQNLRWLYGEYENVNGGLGSDLITGNDLDNKISAGDGNDFITGSGGNDIINGGVGQDTIYFSGKYSDYKITKSNSIFTISSKTALDGTDTVTDVEIFRFSDFTKDVANLLPDLTAPAFQNASSSVDGTKITLTYNESLGSTIPAAKAFVVTVAGKAVTVSSVAVVDSTIELTLASAIKSSQVTTVTYTAPKVDVGTSNAAIQDTSGNDAVKFSKATVLNLSNLMFSQADTGTSKIASQTVSLQGQSIEHTVQLIGVNNFEQFITPDFVG
jgi:uncharacterized repeat protein (TIGR02059 family)